MNIYRIALVENDEDEQFFMQQGFAATGLFQIVAQLKNGNALFTWLEAHPAELPDVILSDLNMPGKNGYDIIETVTTTPAWQHIPVIITSTSNIGNIMKRCLDLGAAAYLVKPDTFIEYEPFVHKLYRLIEVQGLLAGRT